jgi:hypothetical protein
MKLPTQWIALLSICLAFSGRGRAAMGKPASLQEVWDVLQANSEKVETLHMQGNIGSLESEWSSPFLFAHERPSKYRVEHDKIGLLVVNDPDALHVTRFRDLSRYARTTGEDWVDAAWQQLQWFHPFSSLVFLPESKGNFGRIGRQVIWASTLARPGPFTFIQRL